MEFRMWMKHDLFLFLDDEFYLGSMSDEANIQKWFVEFRTGYKRTEDHEFSWTPDEVVMNKNYQKKPQIMFDNRHIVHQYFGSPLKALFKMRSARVHNRPIHRVTNQWKRKQYCMNWASNGLPIYHLLQILALQLFPVSELKRKLGKDADKHAKKSISKNWKIAIIGTLGE